jgi:hypothetical protein
MGEAFWPVWVTDAATLRLFRNNASTVKTVTNVVVFLRTFSRHRGIKDTEHKTLGLLYHDELRRSDPHTSETTYLFYHYYGNRFVQLLLK